MREGLEKELQHIHAAIKECGFYLIKEEELTRLFADGDSGSQRWPLLAKLAAEHEWSFEFHPHDGEVRISLLPSNEVSQSRNWRLESLAESTLPNGQTNGA